MFIKYWFAADKLSLVAFFYAEKWLFVLKWFLHQGGEKADSLFSAVGMKVMVNVLKIPLRVD